jgi:CBS domain-containing protein
MRSIEMIVGNFMTHQVVTVAPDASIVEAAKLMLAHKVSGLPVVDAVGHVVGIVSEHDLLREMDDGRHGPHWIQLMIEDAELPGKLARLHDRKVNEVMTPNPATVAPASSLSEACRLIEDLGVKRLPVVKDGKLVGIIARADLVRALAQAVRRDAVATTRDVSMDERLRAQERQIWRDRARGSKPL